jgi:hypothetical protein
MVCFSRRTTADNFTMLHGKTLPGPSEQRWHSLLHMQNIIIARITPEHKLLIIEQCQRRGEVVAVTGDGIWGSTSRTCLVCLLSFNRPVMMRVAFQLSQPVNNEN